MRIVLDLQGAQTESRYRGIGRYTLSLAKAIIRNRGEHEIFIVLNGLLQESIRSIRFEFADLLPSENIHVWHALGPVHDSDPDNKCRREAAELLREAFIQSLSPDVIHIPSFFEGYIDSAVTSIGLFDTSTPISVTMLDLIPLLNPEEYLTPNPLYQKHYLRKVEQLKLAKKLFAISESARQEALENLPSSTQDVVHQSIAIEPFFKPLNICRHEHHIRRLSLGISKPFVLYTGGADSRKNLPALIQAYTALPSALREQHQLVFAGRIPEGNIAQLRLIADQAGLTQEELYFTGYISDSELIELYNLCELFVFPSWHEGFGLPVLEAMACGAPTIAANTSSLPEVIGIAEALFCPFSIFDMSNKIRLALTDVDYKSRLKKNSLKQVKKFSWDTVAKNSIKSFEEMQKTYPKLTHKAPEVICSEVIEKLESIYTEGSSTEERAEISKIVNTIKYRSKYKKLFIDISELFQRDAATGIQRVTRSLLLELIKNPPENYQVQPVYATPDRIGYYCANSYIKSHNISKLDEYNKPDDIIDYHSGDIFLGLDLQHQVVIAQQDLLRKMRNDGVYINFVVYDLLPILMPHTFPTGVEDIHKQWLTVIADMDHLLCISNSVANELSDWLYSQEHISKPHAKVSWFHLGADIENSIPSTGLPAQAEQILAKLTALPSFLCVGTLEPRKGQSQVLSAFDVLWQQGLPANLILVGKQGWHVEEFIERIKSHPELNKKLFWLDSISDEFLKEIYASAYCLIAASKGEGFGLPIIEAMKYNLPIIARDIPVFREIAGDKATYFVGTTAHALAIHLQELVSLNKKPLKNKHQSDSWLTWFESAQSVKKLLIDKNTLNRKIDNSETLTSEQSLEKKEKNIKKLSRYKKLLKEANNKINLIKTENYKLKISNESSLIKSLQLDSKIKNLQLEAIIERKKENNKEIETLENKQYIIKEILCKNEELSRLSSIILEREHELNFIKVHIEEKNTALLQQENFLAEQQKHIIHISKEKSAADQDIEALRAVLSSQQEQINAVLTSTSWRATYPLRLFNRSLRWIVKLPVRLVRAIARGILKFLILVTFQIRPLRNFLSNNLKSYPSLYGHLKRFSINRNILHSNINSSITKPIINSGPIQPLTPHAHKIYIALKNTKNNNKE